MEEQMVYYFHQAI